MAICTTEQLHDTNAKNNNSTVAIVSGDASDDYYLLKVVSEQPQILKNAVKDDWGVRYPAGAKVSCTDVLGPDPKGMCRWTGYGFCPLCPKLGIQFRASLS
ncbi:unnamed protein product [Porites evermanni]|uniref:Uncharacterized protein n=1 Tax=Porites evermanni TaxID=104178 RepID=A0ABN8M429_9CNID|nr:unnamed protein product [Porites evermanni]